MEAEGVAGDHPDLVVQPFHEAVGHAPADVGHNVIEVPTDGTGDLHESREPAATRPAQPLVEFVCDYIGLVAVQDAGERFFE